MEPAVPFALLGAVTLLSVVAWLALAGAVAATRPGPLRAGLVTAGVLLLSAVDVRTALLFGDAGSDDLSLARAAGFLLLGAGLYAGPLRPATGAVPGVVVPLAAAPAPALVAAASAWAAAVGVWRGSRDRAGRLVALALLLAGVASGLGLLAGHHTSAAAAVLLARGAAALALLAGLLLLARSSLLAKVVAAILAGVVLMAGAAVGVVGSTVVASYDEQAASLVEQAADTRVLGLGTTASGGRLVAAVVNGCPTAAVCNEFLRRYQADELASDFVVRLGTDGEPLLAAGRRPLTPGELIGLRRTRAVQTVLTGAGPTRTDELVTTVQLTGSPRQVALIAVRAGPRPEGDDPPRSVTVYGVRLDDTFASTDDVQQGYGFSVLVGGDVVASNLPAPERAVLQRIADEADIGTALPEGGRTIAAVGSQPTVHLRPLAGGSGEPVGVLAISRDAEFAQAAQREALRDLLLTSIAMTVLVGLLALLLGRRTVEPVQRLTSAVRRVAAGDLTTTTGVRSRDEVGTLSQAFDAMTGSLGRATEDLRASSARLETVLSSMSDGLVATDSGGVVTSINRAALTMSGAPDPAAVLGQRLSEVLDLRDAGGNPLALAGRRSYDGAAEVQGVDGTRTPVSVAVTPLESGDGELLVLRDMTREREVERMKTEFLSNVSHELRTPLTPIRGYADILAARSASLTPKQVAAFAGTILAESLKMNRVVDLLVDVAAIEAGRVTPVPRAVAVRELVTARMQVWRDRAPERAADLRRRVSAALPKVSVDPEWVGKALDELIDNAVKHTPAGTRITLSAAVSPRQGYVRVAVRDAGPGISPDDQAALFTSFEQVDGSATRRVGGLGLGLSFVRRLADDAGYPLSMTSALGEGAEFALDLPVTADAPAAGSRRPASRARRR